MGGGQSQVLQSDVVTNIMSSVTSRHTQSCFSSSSASQIVAITDSSYVVMSGNTFRQHFKVTMTCDMTTQTLDDIRSDIATSISQASKETSQAVFSALNSLSGQRDKQNLKTRVENFLKTDITKETIQKIQASISANQSFVVEGSDHVSILNNTTEQIVDQVVKVMSKVFNQTSLVNEIKLQESKTAEGTQENAIAGVIDSAGLAIKNAASGIGSMLTGPIMSFILFIIAILVAVMVAKRVLGSPSEKTLQQSPLAVQSTTSDMSPPS